MNTRFDSLLVRSLAFVLLTLSGSSAQDRSGSADDPLLGTWQGSLVLAPNTKLRLVFVFETDESGERKGFVVSPDQSPARLPITRTTITGKEVVLDIQPINGKFSGRFGSGGKSITGDFEQNGQSFPLEMKYSAEPWSEAKITEVAIDDESRLIGTWTGKLNLGAMDLTIVLECARDKENGPLKAVLISPDQGPGRLPLSRISLDKGGIVFECAANGGVFEGKLDDKKHEMTGLWKQSQMALPLTLKLAEKPWTRQRPQALKPPFPYKSEDVTVLNPNGGHELSGTLTLPKGGGPFPAVVTITGSGPQDRDETLFQHKPFAVIADHLARKGIAVLRYDDRGTANSGGNFAKATTLDFAGDAWAAVEYLRSRPDIDSGKTGLLGHSEGGLVAPLVAAHHGDVAFMVLLAAPGVPMEALLDQQRRNIGKSLGLAEDLIELSNRLGAELLDMFRSGVDEATIRETSKKHSEQILALMPEETRKIFEPLQNLGPEQMTTPWFRYLIDVDPGTALRKVTCPVLALNGELDLQVAPAPNLEAIAASLRESGNAAVTTRELSGLNHLFQRAKTGSPREYAEIEETFSVEALEIISGWIAEVTGSR